MVILRYKVIIARIHYEIGVKVVHRERWGILKERFTLSLRYLDRDTKYLKLFIFL